MFLVQLIKYLSSFEYVSQEFLPGSTINYTGRQSSSHFERILDSIAQLIKTKFDFLSLLDEILCQMPNPILCQTIQRARISMNDIGKFWYDLIFNIFS